ncbi:unnamed protein product, partial [Iphiclides podalirius]
MSKHQATGVQLGVSDLRREKQEESQQRMATQPVNRAISIAASANDGLPGIYDLCFVYGFGSQPRFGDFDGIPRTAALLA